MINKDILKNKDWLGLVAKEVFYKMEDMEAYKPVIIKVNEDLKNFLESIGLRDGIDKQFIIPDSATLNNLLVVRVEDIQEKSDYYECELLVQLFAEKKDFKPLMELEEKIKQQAKDLSDLEKIEFINTYITENFNYDKEHRSRSSLAFAITHKGTCTAFAQLFLIIGEAVRLKVGCISSKEMKHRWNYAKVDDETYYIDTTFNADNPISNRLFFQTEPIHLKKALDQRISVKHME